MVFLKITFLVFLLNNSAFLLASETQRAVKLLDQVQRAVKDVGGLKSAYSCSVPVASNSSKGYKKTILQSNSNNKKIPLSVISLNEADVLFKAAAEDYKNDFSNPLDYCFARAHRINQFLEEEKGIESAKVFLEGEFHIPAKIMDLKEISWFYHTAAVVMVEIKGKAVPYVFDHILYDKPIPYEEWKKRVTTSSPKSKLKSEYFTNRFVYNRQDKMSNAREWSEEDSFDMNLQLKTGQRQADMMELGSKSSWFKNN